jgi:hypothetical protein
MDLDDIEPLLRLILRNYIRDKEEVEECLEKILEVVDGLEDLDLDDETTFGS